MSARLYGGRLAVGLLALLLLSPFQVQDPTAGTEETTSAPDVAYLALGDSVAAGIGASPPSERGYPALLANRLDGFFGMAVRRINLAVPGETTESLLGGQQMERTLRVLASAHRSGVTVGTISLTIGANDLLQAAPTDDARNAALRTINANVRTILDRIGAAAAASDGSPPPELLVTGYYDPTGTPREVTGSDGWWLARLDDTLKAASTDLGARWVEVAAAFAGRTDELTWYPRDIHPTDAGHAVIAAAAWEALTALPGATEPDGTASPVVANTSLTDRRLEHGVYRSFVDRRRAHRAVTKA